MANYSIKEVEHLSGVKAHTLRIWEQRYEILNPGRTTTNIRAYTSEDLKLILNLAMLTKNGHRIGTIAKLPLEEIKEKTARIANNGCKYEVQIHALAKAMVDLDERSFEKAIATCTLHSSFEKTMLNVVYPFLERIGIMWMTGTIRPAQEHFISNLIRQKLIVAIDGQIAKFNNNSKKIILFLPENEQHELSLLFLHYLLKVRNHRVYYLGANVPFNNIVEVTKFVNPDYLYTIFTTSSSCRTRKYISKLANKINTYKIIASGRAIEKQLARKLPNIQFLDNLPGVLSFLNQL